MSFTFDEIKAKKKPSETSVDVIVDGQLARKIKEKVDEYNLQKIRDSRLNETDKAPAIKKEIEALQEEAADVTFTFVFRDIGRKAFEALQEEYPASKEQKEEGYTPSSDPESATNTEPGLTLEQARDIWDNWGHGEVNALFSAAVNVCAEKASVPFIGTVFQQTPTSSSKSNTAMTTESPTPLTLAATEPGQAKTEQST